MTTSSPPVLEWRRTIPSSASVTGTGEPGQSEEYLISTRTSLVDRVFLNRAFASEDMYWAKEITTEQMEVMLANSQSLGLYRVSRNGQPSSSEPGAQETYEQIGYARLISDYITTAYLTDVYISSASRHKGFGTWLMACTREILESMPAMRRGFLIASPGEGQKFYTRELGFWDVAEEAHHAILMTKRFFTLEGKEH